MIQGHPGVVSDLLKSILNIHNLYLMMSPSPNAIPPISTFHSIIQIKLSWNSNFFWEFLIWMLNFHCVVLTRNGNHHHHHHTKKCKINKVSKLTQSTKALLTTQISKAHDTKHNKTKKANSKAILIVSILTDLSSLTGWCSFFLILSSEYTFSFNSRCRLYV